MSVQSEINRINQNVAATYSVLSEAGAAMPASANTDNLAATAAGIKAVLYGKAQSLTDAQKAQARANIGAISEVDVPKKGVDYWTEADQEAIVQQVIAALGTPVFGRVDDDKNIYLTANNLASGTYKLWFENEEGAVSKICDYTFGSVGPSYTNLLPLSIGSDRQPYNGGQGWKTGYRLNSSGAEVALDGMEVTGFIPVKANDTVYMKNVGWKPGQGNAQQTYLWCYDSSFNCIAYGLASGISLNSTTYTTDESGNLTSFIANNTTFYTLKQGAPSNMAYFRLNCESITSDSIITVNEPIE